MDEDDSYEWVQQALEILDRQDGRGTSVTTILERFVSNCITAGQLDSWVPLGSSTVRYSLVCYLTGVAEELAKYFGIQKKVARLGMANAVLNTSAFSQTPASEVVGMFKSISDNSGKHHPVLEALLLIGKFDAKSWIHSGFDSIPQLRSFLIIQKSINKNPDADIRDPGGLLDELSEYIQSGATNITERFYRENPHFFHAVVSLHYPLTTALISGFQDSLGLWDWDSLSRNTAISWSPELIALFRDRWDWFALSENTALPWSARLIGEYRNKWNWAVLSKNAGIPWSVDLIDQFKDSWKWSWLSGNECIPWSMRILQAYTSRWSATSLSKNSALPWSLELLEDRTFSWNFECLSENRGLPWSHELIKRYEDKWHWDVLSMNTSIPWSVDLLDAFDKKIDWEWLSSNSGLPWSLDLFERYINKWDFAQLSKNEGFPWSIGFIEEHRNQLHWQHLSGNPSLPWSSELLERYADRWLWMCGDADDLPLSVTLKGGISGNRGVPWTMDLLYHYRKNLDLIKIANHYDAGVVAMPAERLAILLSEI